MMARHDRSEEPINSQDCVQLYEDLVSQVRAEHPGITEDALYRQVNSLWLDRIIDRKSDDMIARGIICEDADGNPTMIGKQAVRRRREGSDA